jgi:hypothetical protein
MDFITALALSVLILGSILSVVLIIYAVVEFIQERRSKKADLVYLDDMSSHADSGTRKKIERIKKLWYG